MIKDCEFFKISNKRIDLGDKVYVIVRELNARDGVRLKREIERLLASNNNNKMIALMVRSMQIIQDQKDVEGATEKIKEDAELVGELQEIYNETDIDKCYNMLLEHYDNYTIERQRIELKTATEFYADSGNGFERVDTSDWDFGEIPLKIVQLIQEVYSDLNEVREAEAKNS